MQDRVMDLESASKLLGLTLPTTQNALKRAYHRRAREEHPDNSKARDAAARFDRVKNAFDFLMSAEGVFLFGGEAESVRVATDGTPLSTLGKGLGPNVNGSSCDDCNGNGFSSVREEYIPCPDCRPMTGFSGYFIREFRCKKCVAGVFMRNGNAIGKCFACNGMGWRNRGSGGYGCTTCLGEQAIRNPNGRVSHYKCARCKGCGELPMWNPVLPKGLLSSLAGK